MAKIKKGITSNAGIDIEQLEFSYTIGRSSTLENCLAMLLKAEHMHIPHDLVTPFPVYTRSPKDKFTNVHSPKLATAPKPWAIE